MSKNFVFFLILGVLVCALSITVFSLKGKIVRCEMSIKTLLTKEEILAKRIFELGNLLHYKKNDSVLFYTKDESSFDLSTVTNSSPKFVLIIDPDFCNSCIIEALDFIKLFNSEFGIENALVFINTESDIIFRRTVLDYGISNLAVGYRNGELFPFSHYLQRPYFVILQPDGYSFAFYSAIDNYPDITEKYLLSLNRSYFHASKGNLTQIDE